VQTLVQWLAEYGLGFAFLNVLAEQLGLPVPAYPVLIITGALSVDGRYATPALLGATVLACLLADCAWYFAGRRWGSRVLRTVCRISISPDTCVRQTESLFERWGIWSLLVAKFVPGFGTLATALSGNMRLPLAAFLAVDAIGASLYAGVGIGLGVVFHNAVDEVVEVFENLGRAGLWLLLVAVLLFLATKWWQRERLLRELRHTRITVPELERLMGGALPPAIIDVRSALSRARDGAIPGARVWQQQGELSALPELDHEVDVVVYCACPNEVSAAKVVRQMQRAGFRNVRPLLGGIDAWIAAGLPIEKPDSA
jgi:membrane protein DedA with SNARE-associated domain/rhodanese-related sulfurtransferase